MRISRKMTMYPANSHFNRENNEKPKEKRCQSLYKLLPRSKRAATSMYIMRHSYKRHISGIEYHNLDVLSVKNDGNRVTVSPFVSFSWTAWDPDDSCATGVPVALSLAQASSMSSLIVARMTSL